MVLVPLQRSAPAAAVPTRGRSHSHQLHFCRIRRWKCVTWCTPQSAYFTGCLEREDSCLEFLILKDPRAYFIVCVAFCVTGWRFDLHYQCPPRASPSNRHQRKASCKSIGCTLERSCLYSVSFPLVRDLSFLLSLPLVHLERQIFEVRYDRGLSFFTDFHVPSLLDQKRKLTQCFTQRSRSLLKLLKTVPTTTVLVLDASRNRLRLRGTWWGGDRSGGVSTTCTSMQTRLCTGPGRETSVPELFTRPG